MKTTLSEAEIHELQENLKRRGESFKAGMFLLVDTLKITELKKSDNNKTSQFIKNYEGIIDCVDKFHEEYESKLDDITILEAGKDNLNDLLRKYKQLLQANVSLKDPFQSLCEAERYSVWKKGRKPLDRIAAKSQFEIIDAGVVKSSEYEIRQQEIPCHDPDLLTEEYEKINDKAPPCWFQWQAPWQQDFIRMNQAKLLENSIPSSLRSVPGLANLSKHVFSINGAESLSYFRHATPRPVDLMNNKEAYDEEYRITCLNIASQIRISLGDQFKQGSSKQIKEVVILMQSLLSPGTAADLKSKLSGPNDNDTEIYKMKERVVDLFQIALSQPQRYKDFLDEWGIKALPDGLFKYKNYGPFKITLLSTNHPLNILRRFGMYSQQTISNENNTALLLGAVGRFLKPIFEKYGEKIHSIQQLSSINQLLKTLSNCEQEKAILESDKQIFIENIDNLLGMRHKFDENTQLLFCALQMLLSTPLGQGSLTDADVRHNQLMISSAEAIIVSCIQGSLWAACKSGKDRTGIASAAYDAALLYYNQHKKLLGYKDEKADREVYISLLTQLFDSGHQQEAAGQNAPGAKGIVEPGMILPADVKLDKWTNTISTFLARLNKLPDPDGKKIRVPLSSLKKLTRSLFFKSEKELIAEIEISKTNIFQSS